VEDRPPPSDDLPARRDETPGPVPLSTGSGPRASDADRDRFARMLSRHFSEGRLSKEEFSERLDRVMRARTLGELYALCADLPDLPAVDVPRASGRRLWRFWRP
jgi:hypothetical protein